MKKLARTQLKITPTSCVSFFCFSQKKNLLGLGLGLGLGIFVIFFNDSTNKK